MHKLTVKSTGVAVITPFHADGSVDHDALARIIHFLIDSGIDFLVALGTTGESVTLTNDEKQAVFTTFVRENKQRVPLIMGVGGNCTRSLVESFQSLDVNGFAFSDNFGFGIKVKYNENIWVSSTLVLRHESNANFKFPNSGHNSIGLRLGLVFN